tara:strand:+ start:563 stop:1027 length:465 start_codon:yes stop_codon:yes gene_type:complete
MGGFFSKQIIDTKRDVILTLSPDYYLDNSSKCEGKEWDDCDWEPSYKITAKDKVTKKFYEDYFKKLLKREHEYLFNDSKVKNRHKKIKLLKVSKKQNKIVATYKFKIVGLDIKREDFMVGEGLGKIFRSGDPVFFKKINGKKVYVNIYSSLTQK